jgi:hypothetical protein
MHDIEETRARERRCESRGRDFIEDKLHSIVPVLLMIFGCAELVRQIKSDALRNS